jgi:phage gp45-like
MTTVRTNLTNVDRRARSGASRGTVEEFDDNHLMQQIKKTNVTHGEYHTDIERMQMVGLTAVPLKQFEDQNKTKQSTQSQNQAAGSDEWEHNQPKGDAAESFINYLNGHREHAVAMVDDRRVRPFKMKAGEGAFYAPDGSEQMVFMKDTGAYFMSLDGKTADPNSQEKTRMVSMRHVKKDMQFEDRKKLKSQKQEQGQQNQQQEEYKHEGKEVNLEVRITADKIEFFDGTTNVGSYTKSTKTWVMKTETTEVTLTPDKVVGKRGSNKFAANATGAQIKSSAHHATATAGDLICSKAWTIGPDPMSGV